MSNHRRPRKESGLHLVGSKPVIWDKPAYLNNSQLTLTSDRLSQNTVYTADNCRRQGRHGLVWESDEASVEQSNQNHANMALHPKKSVTFNRSKSAPLTNGGLVNGAASHVNGEVSSTNSDVSSGSGQYRSSRHWYTHPVHLTARDLQHGYSANSQMLNGAASAESASLNSDTNVGNGYHDQTQSASDSTRYPDRTRAEEHSRTTTLLAENSLPSDQVAHDFFPVTLSAAYALSAIDPNKISTVSPPAKALSKPVVPWKLPKSSRSPSRKNRPSSAHSSSSSASRNSIDRMYMMQSEAPSIAGSATVLLSSPFQSELAMLRMERLKIEEEHLLEVKRQEELERIRGPQPKWYELKSPRFHYEAHKNTELLKSSKDWQSLLDYRNELETASQQFQKNVHHSS